MANRKVTAADMTLEKHVAQAGVEWLRLNGWMVHRIQADKHAKGGNRKKHEQEEPGTPDYLITRTKDYGFLHAGMSWTWRWEAKRTVGGKIRQSQKDWAAAHPDQLVSYAASIEQLQSFVIEHFPWSIKTR